MRHDIEIGGRVRHVETRKIDGRFLVTVDGREHAVDAARVDARTLSLLVDSSSYEVTIAADAASGQLRVQVGTVAVTVGVPGRGRSSSKGDGGPSSGPQRLAAPMPGRVVRILVRTGEAVYQGQPLVVVEAMKMENELRASRAGTVTDVFVGEGQSVDAGTPLAVVSAD
jgi:biotin carboxyl carrier protein